MKKSVIINRFELWLSCLMLLFVSCSKEQPSGSAGGSADGSATGSPVEMRLQVNAPMGGYASNNEDAINRLRMVIFGSIGSPDAGKLILNKYYATAPSGNELKEVITSGKRDIYIIANEPLSGGGAELDSYKNIAGVADLRKLALVYQGAGSVGIYTPDEIPMFAAHINKSILVDSQNEVGGEVERTMAKVTMRLNIKNSNFPADKHIVIDDIQIKNLPMKSYLVAQDYPFLDALVDSEKQNAAVVAAASGYNFSCENTFYVPEYIFNNPDSGAYIEITGHVNGQAHMVSRWKVALGDAMDDGHAYGDRYHITRNRHYTFTGDVKSYGEIDDLAVKVTVLPWNTVNQDEQTGRYIAYSKVTDGADAPIADGSNLDEMGTTLKVTCNTNIGGWYTITRDVDNTIVHRSSPTASVSVAALQTVNVTIPKLAEAVYVQNYTVSVYHPTIAMESVGPVKSLNFYQGTDFIPNSVLVQSFTVGGITYAGWPADRLPKTGLLLAKRGNQILPSGVAEAQDPQMWWQTTKTLTAGVETVTSVSAAKLGMGKSSTDAMVATPALAAEHPAANYCREMGPDWYLPSVAELVLIYNNKSTFGDSYTFGTANHWSATQSNTSNSWVVNFSSGFTDNYTKPSNYVRVRCVREI